MKTYTATYYHDTVDYYKEERRVIEATSLEEATKKATELGENARRQNAGIALCLADITEKRVEA